MFIREHPNLPETVFRSFKNSSKAVIYKSFKFHPEKELTILLEHLRELINTYLIIFKTALNKRAKQ